MPRISALALLLVLAMSARVAAAAPVAALADSFLLEVQQTPGGTVAPGTIVVARGATQAFTFTPDGCLGVTAVEVDGEPVGARTGWTFTNVQSDHLLYVAFGAPTTVVTLSVAPDTGGCDLPDTLLARVPGGDGGSVTFFDGDAPLGTAGVVRDSARWITPSMSAGTHALLARFSGSACAQPADSPIDSFVSLASPLASLEVRVSVTPNPATELQSPSIAVSLWAGGQLLSHMNGTAFISGPGTIPITNGVGRVTGPLHPPGTYTITATVTPSSCFGRTSGRTTLTVTALAPTATTISYAPDHARPGGAVTVTARVTPSTATGIVRFTGDYFPLSDAPLVSGVATWKYSVPPYSQAIIAEYLGSTSFHGSSSTAIVVPVAGTTPTTLTASAAPDSVPVGSVVMVSARVEPADATGFVELRDAAYPNFYIDAPVSAGLATAHLTLSTPGTARIYAKFHGSLVYDWSRDSIDVLVYGRSPALTVQDVTYVSLLGAPTTFLAGVGDANAPGFVRWFIDSKPSLDAPFDLGVAALTTSTLPLGDHDVYGMWSEETGLTSNVVTHRVVDDRGLRFVVLAPNGGENLVVGSPTTIRWVPYRFMPLGLGDTGHTGVDLSISRAPGAPWEPIASNVPNTGEYAWTVTGPATGTGNPPVYAATLRVTSYGDVPAGTSDSPFAIDDAQVPALVAAFEAIAADGVVRLTWHIAPDAPALRIERASSAAGPWSPLAADVRNDGDTRIATDANVTAGSHYWYRLVAADGAVLATADASAAVPARFALECASANPSRGSFALSYALPAAGPARLAVLDLQGRRVASLVDGTHASGRFEAQWDARAAHVAPGVYFARLEAGGHSIIRRLAIVP